GEPTPASSSSIGAPTSSRCHTQGTTEQEGFEKALCITLHEKVEKLLTLCSEDVYNDLFALFARVRLHWFARKKNSELLDAAMRRKTKQQVQRLCR
ncbi:unnamed protein product, partial [Ixodes persulcatus]